MTQEQLLAASLFAAVSSITPGPNNTLMLASGVNFGVKRSLPHLAGITLGVGAMLLLLGLGLNALLSLFPALLQVLRFAGVTYLLWLAFALARATPAALGSASTLQPMGFWAAVAFQWVNPKAWVMATTALTAYLPAHAGWTQLALLSGLFMLINAPCVGVWLTCGNAMRAWLQDPRRRRAFNLTMAVALLLSLYPLLRRE